VKIYILKILYSHMDTFSIAKSQERSLDCKDDSPSKIGIGAPLVLPNSGCRRTAGQRLDRLLKGF
jgi:hypothetical protein